MATASDTNTTPADATPVLAQPSEAELKLVVLRERLAEVESKINVALDAYSAAITAANKHYAETAGPLDKERQALVATMEDTEAKIERMQTKRERVAKYREKLAAAEREWESELSTDEPKANSEDVT
jgi:hypothetical protein